jgi:hypothetical protein
VRIATAYGRLRGVAGARTLPQPPLPWRATAFAGTPGGNGGWFAAADGRLVARGDAVDAGNAVPPPVRADIASVLPTERPPVVAIAARRAGGYWIIRDNGAIVGRGGAPELGSTANLALFTQ